MPPGGSVIFQFCFEPCKQAELEAVKVEYANVQLECSAADERSKLLASEVIGLEEKVIVFTLHFSDLIL